MTLRIKFKGFGRRTSYVGENQGVTFKNLCGELKIINFN